MKQRSLKRLHKLHVYAHRRFHDSKPGKCPICGRSHWLWWLGVRTKIEELISEQRGWKINP